MSFSVKTQIVLAISIPLVIIWMGLMWCEYRIGMDEALSDTKSYLSDLASSKTAKLGAEFSKKENLAKTLASVASLAHDHSEEQVKLWLHKSLQNNPEVFGLGIVFEQNALGRGEKAIAAYYSRNPSAEPQYRQLDADSLPHTSDRWYQKAKSGGIPVWTDPYIESGVEEQMVCTYSVPFFKDDQFHGVVVLDVLSEHLLDDILDDVLDAEKGGTYCMLISKDNKLISHPDTSRIMQPANFTPIDRDRSVKPVRSTLKFNGSQPEIRQVVDDRSGLPAWMFLDTMPSIGWSLAAVIPESEIMQPIHDRLFRSLGMLLIGGVVMLGVIWFMSIRVTKPINRLTKAAESLAQGNLDVQVPNVVGTSEISQLAQTFNSMVIDLKKNMEARIQEEATRKAIDSELRMARAIQSALLPNMLPDDPERPFAVHAFNKPAKMVAGDFYDFFFVNPDTLALVMADVSGKGVPAAIYMAVTRTMLRGFTSFEKPPSEVITQLNQALACENDNTMFVTMFLGYYSVSSGKLIYVNAGHNPPYVLRKTGDLETLEPTGPLVAPFHESCFHDAECQLDPQDLLVLFTDGVTEAVSIDGDFYGESRLEALLQSSAASRATEVCEKIATEIDQFSQEDLSDDVTVLVLERTGLVE